MGPSISGKIERSALRMAAVVPPDDQLTTGSGSTSDPHQETGLGFHRRSSVRILQKRSISIAAISSIRWAIPAAESAAVDNEQVWRHPAKTPNHN
jgi:hypothetical protein